MRLERLDGALTAHQSSTDESNESNLRPQEQIDQNSTYSSVDVEHAMKLRHTSTAAKAHQRDHLQGTIVASQRSAQ